MSDQTDVIKHRIVYDAGCSALLTQIDQSAHRVLEHDDPAARWDGEAIHAGLHALSARLVDNELALERGTAVGGWQPIETAPKDGSEVLLSDHGDVYAGFWSAVENYRSWAEPDGNWYAEMDRGNEATAKPQRPQYWRSMRELAPAAPSQTEQAP